MGLSHRRLWVPPCSDWLLLPSDIMVDKDGVMPPLEEEMDDVDLAYRAPEKKTLQEIQQLDEGDESLNKYKRVLLGPIPVGVVDKDVYMMGSYGPRAEEYEFLTPPDEAPKGMLVRGTYHIKSFFIDDDRTDHLSWEWHLCIKKDWKD
uniref:Rho GDP dissociation inhibitor gamma n=1 Tax=Terrapene triunguis TaxID=2587831 RepID=A0A674I6P7_9SAUR